MKFAVTIWIFYNLQIPKSIVSAETIWGNTVFVSSKLLKMVFCSVIATSTVHTTRPNEKFYGYLENSKNVKLIVCYS